MRRHLHSTLVSHSTVAGLLLSGMAALSRARLSALPGAPSCLAFTTPRYCTGPQSLVGRERARSRCDANTHIHQSETTQPGQLWCWVLPVSVTAVVLGLLVMVSANNQALDYDIELSIIDQFIFLQRNTVCFALTILLHIMAMIDRSLMVGVICYHSLIPRSTCGNFQNGVPRTDHAIDHRSVRPNR